MIERALADIGEADLQRLIATGRSEGRQLDFKRDWPGGSDADVRELLADVTSFANSEGGDIIFGMAEDGNSVATELPGVAADGLDQRILAMEARVRDGIDLRLPLFQVHPVPLGNGAVAVVVRIRASLLSPHRVSYKGSSRFYGRNSRGKFEMDTTELRAAFAASESVPDRLYGLHRDALRRNESGILPCRLMEAPALIVTIAPLSILREQRDLPVTRELAVLPPNAGGGLYFAAGLEGHFVHVGSEDDPRLARSWSFNYRRGYMDFAWVVGGEHRGEKVIWQPYFDKPLLGLGRSCVARLQGYGIDGPWVAMATLTNALNHKIILDQYDRTQPAWQNEAYLGQIVDDTLSPAALKPLLDALWRVFGVDRPPDLPADI